MKNYISIEGKRTKLTDEQLNQLGINVDKPKWEDFGHVKGGYIDDSCDIITINDYTEASFFNRSLFPTKQEAKACLALSQLCQWRDKYNKGWKPKWDFHGDNKWIVYFDKNQIKTGFSINMSYVLSFKTPEIRDKFLEDFFELIIEARFLL